jgi:hypothetical protein
MATRKARRRTRQTRRRRGGSNANKSLNTDTGSIKKFIDDLVEEYKLEYGTVESRERQKKVLESIIDGKTADPRQKRNSRFQLKILNELDIKHPLV